MTSIDKILRAKLRNKSTLPQWYSLRTLQCGICEFNSSNKDKLTLREKAWRGANLGSSICTICGCAIKDKAAEPSEQCSLVKLGKTPLWYPIQEDLTSGYVTVTNLSKDKGQLAINPNKIQNTIDEYLFTYNQLKKGDNSKISILIESKNLPLLDFTTSSSCGCTVPKVKLQSSGGIVDITFKTKKQIGDFLKTVVVNFKEGDQDKKIIIKITGNVKY